MEVGGDRRDPRNAETRSPRARPPRPPGCPFREPELQLLPPPARRPPCLARWENVAFPFVLIGERNFRSSKPCPPGGQPLTQSSRDVGVPFDTWVPSDSTPPAR